jgi:predicted DNA-binding protein
MKKEYDFSKGKRGAVLPAEGKTRITIYLDDVVIDRFKSLSEKTGKGYQTLLNEALRAHLGVDEAILTPSNLRRILREELHSRGLTTRSTGPAGTGLLSGERRRRRAG